MSVFLGQSDRKSHLEGMPLCAGDGGRCIVLFHCHSPRPAAAAGRQGLTPRVQLHTSQIYGLQRGADGYCP